MKRPDHDGLTESALRLRSALGKVRPIGAAVGLLLLAAAITVVLRERGLLSEALQSLQSAPVSTVAMLLGSVASSVALTGLVFWILTSRFGRISLAEMQALMAATSLANYLPLRPGLVGRVLFHRARHGIRARDSLRTIVEAMLLTAVALALLVPAILLSRGGGTGAAWLASAAPFALGAAGLAVPRFRTLAWAFELRYLETLLTALRYHLSFALVGAPLPWTASTAVACVSMIATMVPFVSNGIGLREWSIGLLAPLLADVTLERGLAAELVHRAAEVAVIVPLGLLGLIELWRRERGRPLLHPADPGRDRTAEGRN